jgi:L-rhamnose mutarotase
LPDQPPRRFGQVLRVRPEHRESYVAHHAAVWPEVLEIIHRYGIRNYSIFLHEDTLFAYLEYVGDDYEADMRALGEEPKTKEWWAIMEPMQDQLPSRAEGEWWATMTEVFHTD